MKGRYIVIEGPDGVGKSLAKDKVVEFLRDEAHFSGNDLRVFDASCGVVVPSREKAADPKRAPTPDLYRYPKYDDFSEAHVVTLGFPMKVGMGRAIRSADKLGWSPEYMASQILHEMQETHRDVILPALENGMDVVCTRSFLSTIVYQGTDMHDAQEHEAYRPFSQRSFDGLPVDRVVMSQVIAKMNDMIPIRYLKLVGPDLMLVLRASPKTIDQRLRDRGGERTRHERRGVGERFQAIYDHPSFCKAVSGVDVCRLKWEGDDCVEQLTGVLKEHLSR